MKRILIYILILAAVVSVPLERADVADLHPVQTIALYKMEEGYRVETDTDDWGVGKTVDAACADLMDTTPGVIYLDTADFLVVFEGTVNAAQDMRKYLKKSVRICGAIGQGDLTAVGEFLSLHGNLPDLSKWNNDQSLPVLECRNDRIKFL